VLFYELKAYMHRDWNAAERRYDHGYEVAQDRVRGNYYVAFCVVEPAARVPGHRLAQAVAAAYAWGRDVAYVEVKLADASPQGSYKEDPESHFFNRRSDL
jgi:hypothetical protein